MGDFNVYQFILCLVVFIMLTALFTVLIFQLVKSSLRLVKAGLNDDKITTEYLKTKYKKPSIIGKIFDKLLLAVCCIALFVSFGMSISVSMSCNGNKVNGILPSLNVVRSGSMSYISPNHKFLKEGEVTDQLQMFDLVFITKVPNEEDLKVNDIVVYEFKGMFIIHRIVAIEEPNEKHPDQRYFLIQGDANDLADRFPVVYDQIKGLYNGTRIPFVGSFVLFMQSPAGWLCILLVVFAMIATPIAEKKLQKATNERLSALGLFSDESEEVVVTDEDDESKVDWTKLRLKGKKDKRTFMEKMNSSEKAQGYYSIIEEKIKELKNCRIIDGKTRTFKSKNVPVAKLAVRGKTLNVYLGLDPKEFKGTKYKFLDVSHVKKYANYPMRVKITSDRQVRWTKELINLLIEKNNLERGDLND